ncbi:hypothetical protein [Parabacteroides sp. PF5-9]|uniref:hypothetical protein n=1 Tax=Parabacteroides sp. PF5-9 TaxID=1742404 RepID=UPI002474A0A2|nr:hypothetical protein [Parabacteroides sp. PF5-9]MDH6357070.1 hypothetical protein [Parabacteroides sp. PF5-9]
MKELFDTKLFSLLSEASTVTNREIQNAYGHFMEQIESIGQFETDFSKIFRLLTYSRIELKTLQTQILYEQGKKCAQKSLYPKSNMVP